MIPYNKHIPLFFSPPIISPVVVVGFYNLTVPIFWGKNRIVEYRYVRLKFFHKRRDHKLLRITGNERDPHFAHIGIVL